MNSKIKIICLLVAMVVFCQSICITTFATDNSGSSSDMDLNCGHGAYPDFGSEEDIQSDPLDGEQEDSFDSDSVEVSPADDSEALSGDGGTGGFDIPWFPQYFQDDYPDVMFGSGSVATSGCSITCLAMVATYLTGHSYTPDVLADYFGGKANNNMERMEYGIRKLQLPCDKNWNWHRTLEALRNGKIAIVLVGKNSPFTDGQHFLVLSGMTSDGRILVRDSNRANYDRWDLIPGFERGFLPEDVSAGFSGAWVFDPDAMSDNPYIYEGESLPYTERRYNDVQLSVQDLELLAKVVWVEAQGESFEGQQAVAEVILNRLVAENFPSSIRGIVYAEGQFRSVPYLDKAEPTQMQYEAIERALYGPYVLPIDVVYFGQNPSNDNIWGRIGGHVFCYQWWVTDGERNR